MGLIQDLLGIGRTVGNVAEVFVPNKTKQKRQEFLRAIAANEQFAAEFNQRRTGFFDQFVDGLNRLPRPVMALGTVGLFVYAMVDPIGFTTRMQGLDYVPDPLWWLLGAVVSFYFGAREMHHFRKNTSLPQASIASTNLLEQPVSKRNLAPDDNAALTDWRNSER